MMNFNRGSKSFGGRGGKKFGGRGDTGRPAIMHEAICDECGNPCNVPFKPNGKKPVFCNSCFKKGEKPAYPQQSFSKSPAAPFNKSAPPSGSQDQFAILNNKLDKILKMLSEGSM